MNNAFEALYTGVYIFVFIVALTITLYLFRNVNELAEASYDYGISATSGSLVEAPANTEAYLTPDEVVPYYFNYVKNDIYGGNKSSKYKITIYDQYGNKIGNDINYTNLKGKLGNKNYVLKYKGHNNFSIEHI